jgi:hypothetical protein
MSRWTRLGALRERRWRVVAAVVVGIAPVIAMFMGCADVLGIVGGRYVGASEDASDSGSPNLDDGGPWGCLGLPVPTPNHNEQITVNVFGYNAYEPVTYVGTIDGGSDLILATYTPISGVPVRSCILQDPTCYISASPFEVTDDAGGVSFVVPGDFAGFFELDPPGLIPETLYPGPLAVGQSVQEFFDPMESIETASGTSLALGVPVALGVDSGLGQIFIGVFDCNDHTAPNVAFSLTNYSQSPPTVIFYNAGGVPSTVETRTQPGQGGGGVVDPRDGDELAARDRDRRRARGRNRLPVHAGEDPPLTGARAASSA